MAPALVTLGCKAPTELRILVDKAILHNSSIYKDRSEFVRIAIRRHVEELEFHEDGCTEGAVNPQTQGDETSRALEELFVVNRKERQS